MEFGSKELELRLELMSNWILEDEDSGDILGLKDGAPDEMKAEYEKYLKEMESTEPIIR